MTDHDRASLGNAVRQAIATVERALDAFSTLPPETQEAIRTLAVRVPRQVVNAPLSVTSACEPTWAEPHEAQAWDGGVDHG